MVIFTNSKNEIKDVGSTTNVELTGHVIDDNDNPFKDWSTAKICCYKATVIGGKVTMMTPYVDSRLLEHIEQLGKAEEQNADDITEAEEAIAETYELVDSNATDITDVQEAIAELYDLIIESEV